MSLLSRILVTIYIPPCKALPDTPRTVPVYDGRQTYFDVNNDLPYLQEMLPPFSEEIPQHSCIVVGHTATCYQRKQGGWGIGFNIKWVVVLATPPQPVEEGTSD
jgi:hypothetical protein